MDELEDGGWFIGIVDDVNDPKKLGRVKVRILDDYDQSVDSEDIPWAIVLGPTTGAAFLGVGHAVVGMMPGSRVIGFYLDGDKKTKPLVMGTLPFILKGNELDHSTSSIARGSGPIKKDYLESEPKTQYAAKYPFNKTITTVGGHIIELDDTPEAERIHIFHRSGTYIEMNQDGSLVIKTLEKRFDITTSDHVETVLENQTVSVAKDQTLLISKNQTIGVGGTISIGSAESIRLAAPGGVVITEGGLHVKGSLGTSLGATGTFTSVTGQIIHVQNGIITQID